MLVSFPKQKITIGLAATALLFPSAIIPTASALHCYKWSTCAGNGFASGIGGAEGCKSQGYPYYKHETYGNAPECLETGADKWWKCYSGQHCTADTQVGGAVPNQGECVNHDDGPYYAKQDTHYPTCEDPGEYVESPTAPTAPTTNEPPNLPPSFMAAPTMAPMAAPMAAPTASPSETVCENVLDNLPNGQYYIRLAHNNHYVYMKPESGNYRVEARPILGGDSFIFELDDKEALNLDDSTAKILMNVGQGQDVGARPDDNTIRGQGSRAKKLDGYTMTSNCDEYTVNFYDNNGNDMFVTTEMVTDSSGEEVERLMWTDVEAEAKKLIFEPIDATG